MEILKQRIEEDGVILNNQVLNLDAILNHMVDPHLMMEVGHKFAKLFQDESITKILTIESSGIPPGFAVAYAMNVPLVFAKRKKTLMTDRDSLFERVPSFTKGIVSDIVISRRFLTEHDNVLIIDDIIANGNAAQGLIRIVEKSDASLAGLGIVVEKTFQSGADKIRELGYRVESLVKIAGIGDGEVRFL